MKTRIKKVDQNRRCVIKEKDMLQIVEAMSYDELAEAMAQVVAKVNAASGPDFYLTPHGVVDAMRRGIGAEF